jgi:hypothetical protein
MARRAAKARAVDWMVHRRRAAARVMPELTTTTAATPTKTSVVEPVKSGSIWEKITATRPTSMTFSRVPVERMASYLIRQASCSSGSSIASGSGSGRNRQDQSGGQSRGRTSFWKARKRPSRMTRSSPMSQRWRLISSVTSSWATCSQYSWGSFTTTQITAAALSHQPTSRCTGCQRERIVS